MSIDEEYVNTTKYINILNELNIFYYLAFGSELAELIEMELKEKMIMI